MEGLNEIRCRRTLARCCGVGGQHQNVEALNTLLADPSSLITRRWFCIVSVDESDRVVTLSGA